MIRVLTLIFVIFFCSCHPSRNYFDEAHDGFERNMDSCLQYMVGHITGDSVATARYNLAHDSTSYFRGAEDYIIKMQQ